MNGSRVEGTLITLLKFPQYIHTSMGMNEFRVQGASITHMKFPLLFHPNRHSVTIIIHIIPTTVNQHPTMHHEPGWMVGGQKILFHWVSIL
jgi:hypothetical protein